MNDEIRLYDSTRFLFYLLSCIIGCTDFLGTTAFGKVLANEKVVAKIASLRVYT
jgi:hypothetical protein